MFDPAGFEYRDEFFRVHEPYSRHRLRVLLSIDTARTDLNQGAARGACVRADNDYALAWVRACGRGRVFYSTIAHNPYVFWDPRMLEFYLAAAQFALGDLPAPTVPSARLTPGERARETLGWRLGIEAYTFHKYTLFEAIDKTAALGLAYLGGLSFQNVSAELPKPFDPQLSPAEVRAVRQRLDAAGLRLLTYYIHRIPGDEAGCRQVFDFARRLGIETLISEPDPAALDTIARFCDAYDIRVALHNHDRTQSPQYWRPEGVLQACQGRTPRLGACGDVGYWVRSGIDPVRAVRTLRGRLITLQVHDLHTRGPNGRDVPWGTGATRTARLVREVHRLGLTPTMWGLEYSDDWYNSLPEIAASMAFFDRTCLDLAR
jgi:sugar phosphate isomerase/epimerase